MASRQPQVTRERILQAAFQAVYRHGLSGTVLDSVLVETGVTKGALYHHFDGKRALGCALIEEMVAPRVRTWWIAPVEAASDPIAALQGLLRDVVDGPSSEEVLRYGCPLSNLVQEVSALDEELRARVDGVLQGWIEAMRRSLVRGQASRTVRADVDPERAARFLVGAIEGALGLAKATRDREVLRSAFTELSGYLESLRPAARPRPGRQRTR